MLGWDGWMGWLDDWIGGAWLVEKGAAGDRQNEAPWSPF